MSLDPQFELQGHSNVIQRVVLLPSGVLASVSDDRKLCLWDLEKRALLHQSEPHAHCINDICLSPDGSVLFTVGDDGALRATDPVSLASLTAGFAHTGYVSRVLCSADGQIITGGQDGKVGLWRYLKGVFQLERMLEGHRGWVYAMGLGPDGRLYTASLNNELRVWSLPQGDALGALYGEGQGPTTSVLMSTIYIAPANTSGRGHRDAPHVLLSLPDGSLLSCAKDVRRWDMVTGEEQVLDEGVGWQIHYAALFDAGRKVALVSRTTLRLYDLEHRRELAKVKVSGSDVHALLILPGERTILVGTATGQLLAWDMQEVLCHGEQEGHGDSCNSIVWSARGDRLATGGSDSTARIWSAEGRQLAVLKHGYPNIQALGLTDELCFSGHFGHFQAWAVQGGAPRYDQVPKGMAGYNPHQLWFSPDGRYGVTTGVLHGLVRWDLATGEAMPFDDPTRYHLDLCWEPDGQTFFTSRYADKGFGDVQRWDLHSLQRLAAWGDPLSQLKRVRKSSDKDYASRLYPFPALDRMIVTSSTGQVYGHRMNGELIWVHKKGGVLMACVAEDSLLVLAPGEGKHRLLRAEDGRATPALRALPELRVLRAARDRWLVGMPNDRALIIIDRRSGEIALRQDFERPVSYSVAFSPDSRKLALGLGDGTLGIYTLQEGPEGAHWS